MADCGLAGEGALDVLGELLAFGGVGDWVLRAGRISVVGAAFEFAASLGFADAAPLFEEKWDVGLLTLVAEGEDPVRVHRSGTGPLSPPTMTQLIFFRLMVPRSSSNGSTDRNATSMEVFWRLGRNFGM
jgi:hypothetical protein